MGKSLTCDTGEKLKHAVVLLAGYLRVAVSFGEGRTFTCQEKYHTMVQTKCRTCGKKKSLGTMGVMGHCEPASGSLIADTKT